MYRHGDLILKPINELPSNAKLVEKTNVRTLAYGEFTGHHHDLAVKTRESGTFLNVYELDGKTYLQVDRVGELTHQEHSTLIIQPGIYELGLEREYDYFLEETRKVQD